MFVKVKRSFDITCSKLFNCHERKANEGQGFAEDPTLVLRGGLELLALGLSFRPAYSRCKQTHLPHPQRVPLQNCY